MSKVSKMAEKHSVSISEKLYNEIKEYCQLNELKLNIFVEDLIRDAFNVERYGATPFDKKPEIKPPEQKQPIPDNDYVKSLEVVKDFHKKILEGVMETEEKEKEAVEDVKPVDVSEIIFEEPKTEPEEKKPKRKITRLN